MTKTYLRYRSRVIFLSVFIIFSWAGLCIRLFQVQAHGLMIRWPIGLVRNDEISFAQPRVGKTIGASIGLPMAAHGRVAIQWRRDR